jgi:hypothetical protein
LANRRSGSLCAVHRDDLGASCPPVPFFQGLVLRIVPKCVQSERRQRRALAVSGRSDSSHSTSVTSPRVAVRALCEDGHAGAEYVLTGPPSPSQSSRCPPSVALLTARFASKRSRQTRRGASDFHSCRHSSGICCSTPGLRPSANLPTFTSTVAQITGSTFLDWTTDHAVEFRA